MTPEEAEAILALADEVAVGVELAGDETVFRADWRIRYAAERVIERVFQAASELPEALQERYFGGDGFRALRGMRNRLAHSYLDIDDEILWESVSSDLPSVWERLTADSLEAKEMIDRLMAEQDVDPAEWDREHLGEIEPSDPD